MTIPRFAIRFISWSAAPLLVLTLSAGIRAQSPATSTPQKGTSPAATAPDHSPDPAQSYYHYLLAQDALSRRDYAQAATEFKLALDFAPDNADLRLEYAQFLIKIQNYKEANLQLQKCLELNPKQVEAHKLLARLYSSTLNTNAAEDPRMKEILNKTIQEYETVLKLDPDDTESLYELGRLYMNINRPEEAESYLKRFVNRESDSLEGLYYLTLVYFQQQKFSDALQTLQQLEKIRPGWQQLKLLKADILSRMNRTEEAAKLYQELIDGPSADPPAYLRYAEMLIKAGQPDKAIDILTRAIKNSVVNADIHNLLGRLYRDKLLYDKAIQSFKDAIALDPADLDYRYQLGLTYSRMGDTPNAIAIFKTLLKDTEPSGDDGPPDMRNNRRIFLLNLGFLYVDARKYVSALEVFETLRRDYADAKDPIVYIQQADILNNLDKPKEALEVLDDGLKLMPDNIRLLSQRALILQSMGRADEAVADLENRLKSAQSPAPELYQGLAGIYSDNGQYDKALQVTEKGLAAHAKDTSLLFQKGSILEKLKRYADARQIFLDLLAAEPDNANAWNYLGYMLIDYNIDVEAGIRYVKKALDFEPDNPAFIDSLGWGLYKKKEYPQALEKLLQAARSLPDDPVIFEHLGDIYVALGRSHDARDSYQKALNIQKDPEERTRVAKKIEALKPKLLMKEN